MSPEEHAQWCLDGYYGLAANFPSLGRTIAVTIRIAETEAARAAVAKERERCAAQSMRLLADVAESDFEKGNIWQDVVRWMRQHADAAEQGKWKPLDDAR